MFSGGVGQVESTASVVAPTHELDSDLVASGVDQLINLQTQAAVFGCQTAQETQDLVSYTALVSLIKITTKTYHFTWIILDNKDNSSLIIWGRMTQLYCERPQ